LAEGVLERHKNPVAGIAQKGGLALAQLPFRGGRQLRSEQFKPAHAEIALSVGSHFHVFSQKMPIRLELIDNAGRPPAGLQAVNAVSRRAGFQHRLLKLRVQ
jgi:hypothetical protein